jgi:hypothetical protein
MTIKRSDKRMLIVNEVNPVAKNTLILSIQARGSILLTLRYMPQFFNFFIFYFLFFICRDGPVRADDRHQHVLRLAYTLYGRRQEGNRE